VRDRRAIAEARLRRVERRVGIGVDQRAIRQQLVMLERDGLVIEQSVRRGPTKPTHQFSLTSDGEKLFPHHYDKMLGAVLREVREQHGETGIAELFKGISKRTVAKARARVTAGDTEGKIGQLTQVLREGGVVADYNLIEGGFELHEHNCPYSAVAKDNPEVCSVIHQVLAETIGGTHVQTESLATGGSECKFELKA